MNLNNKIKAAFAVLVLAGGAFFAGVSTTSEDGVEAEVVMPIEDMLYIGRGHAEAMRKRYQDAGDPVKQQWWLGHRRDWEGLISDREYYKLAYPDDLIDEPVYTAPEPGEIIPYSWDPAAKTNAIYLDGLQDPATIDTSWIEPGTAIGVFLHSDGDVEARMWAGARERIEAGEPTLDLSEYAAYVQRAIVELDRRGLRVDMVFFAHEDYGDAAGLAKVETGGGPGPAQPGLFAAAGLGHIDAENYRDPKTLDDIMALSEKETLAYRDQLDREILQLFRNQWGVDVKATNWKWGDYRRLKDGVPMPNVRFGRINNPVTYGPQKWGDRLEEFKLAVAECARTGETVVWVAASSYYSDPQVFREIIDYCHELGIRRVLLWHPTKYRYDVDPAVAKSDADIVRSVK